MTIRAAWLLIVVAMGIAGAAPRSTAGEPRRMSEAMEEARQFYETGEILNEPKIVGGWRTTAGDDRWQVALVFPEKVDGRVRLFCGGSIVAPEWVVTAAHCVDRSTKPNDLRLLAGTINLYEESPLLSIDRIIVHPQWQPAPRRWNDIALLHLRRPLSEKDAIGLPPQSSDVDSAGVGRKLRVTGWGAVGAGGGSVQFLRWVDPVVVSQKSCSHRASYAGRIDDGMVCAGYGVGGRDSCQGDSGGPLSANGTLIGIVSWGDGCGDPDKYGVYTRVAKYVDWIDASIRQQGTRRKAG